MENKQTRAQKVKHCARINKNETLGCQTNENVWLLRDKGKETMIEEQTKQN